MFDKKLIRGTQLISSIVKKHSLNDTNNLTNDRNHSLKPTRISMNYRNYSSNERAQPSSYRKHLLNGWIIHWMFVIIHQIILIIQWMIGKSWLKTGILLEWMKVISMNVAFWKLLPFGFDCATTLFNEWLHLVLVIGNSL